jgi:hypothetical protein
MNTIVLVCLIVLGISWTGRSYLESGVLNTVCGYALYLSLGLLAFISTFEDSFKPKRRRSGSVPVSYQSGFNPVVVLGISLATVMLATIVGVIAYNLVMVVMAAGETNHLQSIAKAVRSIPYWVWFVGAGLFALWLSERAAK